jgi:hypothetical protein
MARPLRLQYAGAVLARDCVGCAEFSGNASRRAAGNAEKKPGRKLARFVTPPKTFAAREGSLIPKSEIETGNLPQSLGHKRIEKISTDHFGYASMFSMHFRSKILRHLAGLNFGFQVETRQEKARRSIAPELKRLGWKENDLRQRRKGDPEKVKLAPGFGPRRR